MIKAQSHFLISFDIDITQLVPLLFRGPTQFCVRPALVECDFTIDLVYTRSTPPRWRVAVQLAGA